VTGIAAPQRTDSKPALRISSVALTCLSSGEFAETPVLIPSVDLAKKRFGTDAMVSTVALLRLRIQGAYWNDSLSYLRAGPW
jgi:hypothetical protein